MKVLSNWDQKRLYDVIAKIPGSEFPNEWVLRGNHHDAWVNGAEDPISGLITVLEEARSFGELVKQGWKPKRTLVYCAWDGEEPGLLGPTEWVEDHSDELLQHAVAYFNSDTNARGYFRAEGSHVLEKFINDVARDITDPEKDITAWQRRKLYDIAHAQNAEQRDEIRKRGDLRIGALGDGSDYTAFIHHLGIPSADIRFSGESSGGVYHSIYDDFYSYTHFGDPTLQYALTESQLVGTAVMRLADADLLPFDFTRFADTVKMYLGNLQKQLKKEQDEIRERNRELEEGVFSASSDPEKPLLSPPAYDIPPHFNFAPLENAIDALSASAERYAKAIAKVQANEVALSASSVERVNRLLMESGPALTDPTGLPGRPWFKNQIYAPGAYTGYEAKPLPGVLEAMDRKNWKEAESQIPREAEALDRAGVHRITFHELRHTFGTRMAAAGTPMRTLQHWMVESDTARPMSSPVAGRWLRGRGGREEACPLNPVKRSLRLAGYCCIPPFPGPRQARGAGCTESSMRIQLVADIHANWSALQAVAAEPHDLWAPWCAPSARATPRATCRVSLRLVRTRGSAFLVLSGLVTCIRSGRCAAAPATRPLLQVTSSFTFVRSGWTSASSWPP